jgi:hypothetical protein
VRGVVLLRVLASIAFYVTGLKANNCESLTTTTILFKETVALICVCVYGIVHGLEWTDTDSGTHLNTEQ